MIRLFSKLIDNIMSLSLVIMSILVFLNVVLRYIFNYGLAWGVELSQILFLVMVFLGSIQAFKDKIHVNVDVLINVLPEKAKKIFNFISNILILGVLYIIFDGSLRQFQTNMAVKTPVLGIPMSFYYALGIILSVSMTLTIFYNAFKAFKAFKKV